MPGHISHAICRLTIDHDGPEPLPDSRCWVHSKPRTFRHHSSESRSAIDQNITRAEVNRADDHVVPRDSREHRLPGICRIVVLVAFS